MNIEESHGEFSFGLSDVSQVEKVRHMEQIILDLMDYTEQSEEEHIWCELYKKLQELKVQYPPEKINEISLKIRQLRNRLDRIVRRGDGDTSEASTVKRQIEALILKQ